MLSDIAIKAAQPKEKKYKLTDKDGLYILILPNGRKYFKYRYYIDRKGKDYSIGVYPQISLKEARLKLIEVKEQLRQGINPNEYKKQKKQEETIKSLTLEDVAKEWYEDNKNKWTERHALDKWGKISNFFISHSPLQAGHFASVVSFICLPVIASPLPISTV